MKAKHTVLSSRCTDGLPQIKENVSKWSNILLKVALSTLTLTGLYGNICYSFDCQILLQCSQVRFPYHTSSTYY
jgi:hypothetical protein